MADTARNQGSLQAGGVLAAGAFLRRYADWFMGLGVLGLVLTLISPIPPQLLDILLSINLTGSLLLLLVTMSTRSSTELSVFPTILLFGTLYRLGLNVASTRLILSGGEAGAIIGAFGSYVSGDNLMVGLVVFLILVIIQFIVITKGSGRVSEVAARFVLDAMPGKQMAIDADLNGGLIDADDARRRREAIAAEAEFYGAMDGASKFVRGDAIAGLIITSLNLLGGVAIATFQGMTVAQAGQRYSLLTIGDGLVSQIPALIVSTAAAVLVTKAASRQTLGHNMIAQIGGRPRATLIASGMLFAIGLLPGMPKVPFFLLATLLLIMWRSTRGIDGPEALLGEPSRGEALVAEGDEDAIDEDESVEELLQIDRVALEIGYRIIPLVQDPSGAGILDHIAQLRRRFATRDGLVMPPVRIKDNIRLPPNGYRILIGGQEVASGEIETNRFLAMDGGTASGAIEGRATTDPAFGLPAVWVDESQRDEAEILGYTVIDPTSVLVTHLSEIVRESVGDILSRDDVKELVETARKHAPAVVEELVPDKIGYGEIQAILRNLLRESVPIRNLPAILEVVADNVAKTKDPETLTELVRQRLGRVLCEMYSDANGVVHAVTLDPSIETQLAAAVHGAGNAALDPNSNAVSPAWLQRLVENIGACIADSTRGGVDVVLLVRSNVRRFINELVRSTLPKVSVLSYNEVVPAKSVETTSIVKLEG